MASRMTAFFSRWWSVVVAVVFGSIWVVEGSLGITHGSQPVAIVFGVLTPLVFVSTRRFPLPGALAVVAMFVIQAVLDAESLSTGAGSGLLAGATACVFGALPKAPERLAGLGVLLAGTVGLLLRVPPETFERDGVGRSTVIVSNLILFTIVWTLAWVIAGRVRAARDLRARAARLEAERDAVAHDAVLEERARIARELHDVVAHSVSVMTVQAGGVRRLLNDDQGRQQDALAAIEETGRQALAEMRRMVGVMRAGDDGHPDRSPQPGLAELDRLVDEIRDAGLPVTLTVDGPPVDLPPGVDLSAYRIVQESLTNTLKHAGPARAWVTVTRDADQVDVVVEDDGAGQTVNGAPGHGLIGMRERVAVYGGAFDTGARPGGGFRVHARFPLSGDGS